MAELPKTQPYRVVIAGAIYDAPRLATAVDGASTVIAVTLLATRGQIIDLTDGEATRLTDLLAVKPSGSAKDVQEMSDDELDTLVREANVRVMSSGASADQPLRIDKISALENYYRGGALAAEAAAPRPADSPSGVPDGAPDVATADVATIAAFIDTHNLTAPQTVTLAGESPEGARKVLEAEQVASGGDPRATVAKPLSKQAGG